LRLHESPFISQEFDIIVDEIKIVLRCREVFSLVNYFIFS
jgi:hypothetical protein